MRKAIRNLSANRFAGDVLAATDPTGKFACNAKVEEWLEENPSAEQRIALLRDSIGNAAMKPVASPDELQIEQPLVEALLRTYRHPAMPREMPDFYQLWKGIKGGPRFAQLADQRPDLTWDKALVRALLWTAIQANGDHELDDAYPPWQMNWGPSAMAAQALIVFFTLDAMTLLGD